MGLGIKKTTGRRYVPVFQKILEHLTGGGVLKTGSVPSDVKEIREGTLIAESTSTSGLFNIVKRGRPLASVTATGTTLFVNSNALFKAGEYLMKEGGSTLSTITSVTRSGSTLTVIVGTCIGTLSSVSVVYESSSAATGSLYSPSAILADDVAVRNDDLSTIPNVLVSGVVRGTVDESRLATPVKASDKTALTDRIRFA